MDERLRLESEGLRLECEGRRLECHGPRLEGEGLRLEVRRLRIVGRRPSPSRPRAWDRWGRCSAMKSTGVDFWSRGFTHESHGLGLLVDGLRLRVHAVGLQVDARRPIGGSASPSRPRPWHCWPRGSPCEPRASPPRAGRVAFEADGLPTRARAVGLFPMGAGQRGREPPFQDEARPSVTRRRELSGCAA